MNEEFNPLGYKRCSSCGKLIDPFSDHKCQVIAYVSDSTGVTEDRTNGDKIRTVRDFVKEISKQQDLPPEIQKLINEHFWDLL